MSAVSPSPYHHFRVQCHLVHPYINFIQETYNNQTSGIAEKTNELSEISSQLESIKNEMEERGQMISDGKPIQQGKCFQIPFKFW